MPKHYIAYHSEENSGGPLTDDSPFVAVSDRPLDHTVGHVVWYVTSSGGQYYLESVFIAGEVMRAGPTGEGHAVHCAPGTGKEFDVPLALNDLPWFPGFMKKLGNFGTGVHETTDTAAIAAMTAYASAAGWWQGE